VLLIYLSIVV